MRRSWVTLVIAVGLALATIAAGSPPAAAEVVAGNSIYLVHVDEVPAGDGVGTYTVTTGGGHSAGSGLNVLYGNADAWSSFNTIRSYTTGTDYVQTGWGASPDAGFALERLDGYGVISPIGSTGYRTDYVLPGAGTAPDALHITSDVNVNGVTEGESTVEVTTTVANTGVTPVDVGIRYQWDFQIDIDDGPTFRAENPDGPVLYEETDFPAPTGADFQSYVIGDNANGPPTFEVHGTVSGPTSVVPLPTPPERLAFACWPESFSTAFSYTVVPGRDITGGDTACFDDSNVLYYWGAGAETAIRLDPGASHTVSQSLFLRVPEPIPTLLTLSPAVVDVVSPGTQAYLRMSGVLTNANSGAPAADVLVRFTNDGIEGVADPINCEARANANGFVTCGALFGAADATATSFRYCAESEETSAYLSSSSCAPAARLAGVPIV